MKTITKIILTGLISAVIFSIIGFLLGRSFGNLEFIDSPPSYLRGLLKVQEIKEIIYQLELDYDIVTVDEGGLFTVKNVTYLKGTIKNNASVAKAKDIKLTVGFFSKTDSQIGEREITIYEYINPNSTLNIKEKLDVPNKAEKFSCIIKSADGE